MHLTALKFISILTVATIKPHLSVEFDLDFVESKNFVDKTDFLREFFDKTYDPFGYVTAPRGFGKSSLLKMIDKFSHIELDEQYNPKHWSQTSAYEIFNKTKIARDEKTMRHLARYAVIYLDLNFTIARASQIDEFVVTRMFNERLHECFKRYEWMMHLYKKKYAEESPSPGTNTSKIDVEFLQKALHVQDEDPDLKSYFKKLNDLDIEESLMKLAQMIRQHFNKIKVILLVDNLDETFHQLYLLANKDQVSELTSLSNTVIIVLYNALYRVKEILLTRALCVGVSTLVISCETREILKDFKVYKFLDDNSNKYTSYMTFSQQDIDQLCQTNNCTQNDRKNIKIYCNGYHSSVNRTSIYNPASAINYLQHRAPRGIDISNRLTEYGTVINMFAAKSKDFKQYLASLLAGKAISFTLWPKYDFTEFMELMQYSFENVYKKMFYCILTFCYDYGLITHGKAKDQFIIPNKEMKNYIAEIKS